MTKELLFSVTKKDFTIQPFKGSGPGGQHRNKNATACRIIHEDSGARGESQEHKSFQQNRKEAFRRLVSTKEFKSWHKRKCAELLTSTAERQAWVDNAMHESKLSVEYGV